MGKDESTNREANGDPKVTKTKGKETESQKIAGSKSGKKQNGGNAKSTAPCTVSKPPSEKGDTQFSKLEKHMEVLASSVTKLTADMQKIKSNQDQGAYGSNFFGNTPNYFDAEDEDMVDWPDHDPAYEYTPHNPDVDPNYYDLDTPLISDVNKSDKDCDENETVDEQEKEKQLDYFSEYTEEENNVSNDVASKLANGVNSMFKHGMKSEKYKAKIAEVSRPSNATALTSVEVEDIIWNLLQPQTKSFDKRLQIIQTALARSACSFTQMMDLIQEAEASKLSDKSWKQELARLGTTGLALMGHAFHNLCLRRRELHKPDVAWKYANLFAAEVEHNQFLYGGKEKVEQMIKDIGTVNKVANDMHRRGTNRYNHAAWQYPYPRAQSTVTKNVQLARKCVSNISLKSNKKR